MIAYFDTSALVPLVVEEPSSAQARLVWNEASRALSVMLVYTEGRAALARARRMGRLDGRGLRRAARDFEELFVDLDTVEVDDLLVRRAGDLAETWSLRAYDALHLAAAERVAREDSLLVSADRAMCAAARANGLMVSEL